MITQVYRDEALVCCIVFNWHTCFAQEIDNLEDHVRTGRPTTDRTEPKIEEIAPFVRANRSQSADDLIAAVRIAMVRVINSV